MVNRARLSLVPFALCVIGIFVVALSGCERKVDRPSSAGEECPAHSPQSYMNDPDFRRQLDELNRERGALAGARAKLVAEMKKMVDAAKAAHPGAGDEQIKAVLEKDPAWRSLHSRVTDLNTALKEQRRQAMQTVGRRVVPQKKEISK